MLLQLKKEIWFAVNTELFKWVIYLEFQNVLSINFICSVIYAISIPQPKYLNIPIHSNVSICVVDFIQELFFYFKTVYIPKQTFNDATKQLEIDVWYTEKFEHSFSIYLQINAFPFELKCLFQTMKGKESFSSRLISECIS